MPELPEVETVARGLQKHIAGDTIDSVWIGARHQPLKSSPDEIAAALEGARIDCARRVGKHIAIDLHRNGSESGQWIVHLGMTGRMLVTTPDAPIDKHTHLIAKLHSGRELRFIDPRMFGKLAVTREAFKAPGSEPLDIGFEIFVNLFRGRKTPIKSALLNQSLLSGVGNIYADESLARAGVRPRRRAASLTRNDLRRLYDALQKVLREAIKLGGSSVSDYVGAEGERGFFQIRHLVYGREGEPCRKCKTPIKRIVISGRSSHYCPTCQK
ncbi:MAG TPA: bifunctional DNA-formamidopyrimidine glycosylase/DNA-(apurinic or apyrimidinic site) lyase [Terriglobales bacterium]|nr:bifunctional DNA-formamidopyrimidine glycosylase/DNA-(apurinic or apyrimidinic site) lyase [Terriglobales bacterium]